MLSHHLAIYRELKTFQTFKQLYCEILGHTQ